jgi:glycosyltransferase involved in cell wall biosynthesis
MKINAITVCVNYADYLANSISRWKQGTDALVVVTTPEDEKTIDLCEKNSVFVHTTNIFTANGATFNKGAALVEAIERSEIFAPFMYAEWCLFFDSDIVPPEGWRDKVEAFRPTPGYLYGAHRFEQSTFKVYPDGELAGYFAMAHVSDPNMHRRPLLQTDWLHAGGYDSEFQARWHRPVPYDRRVWFNNFTVMHQGEPGRNWWGRAHPELMDAMNERRARKPGFDEERIK